MTASTGWGTMASISPSRPYTSQNPTSSGTPSPHMNCADREGAGRRRERGKTEAEAEPTTGTGREDEVEYLVHDVRVGLEGEPPLHHGSWRAGGREGRGGALFRLRTCGSVFLLCGESASLLGLGGFSPLSPLRLLIFTKLHKIKIDYSKLRLPNAKAQLKFVACQTELTMSVNQYAR
jgi:hypothetical protein